MLNVRMYRINRIKTKYYNTKIATIIRVSRNEIQSNFDLIDNSKRERRSTRLFSHATSWDVHVRRFYYCESSNILCRFFRLLYNLKLLPSLTTRRFNYCQFVGYRTALRTV